MSDTNQTRRRFATILGTTVAVSLAGCSTLPGGDGESDDSDDSMSGETTTESGMSNETMDDGMGNETMDDGMGNETTTDSSMGEETTTDDE